MTESSADMRFTLLAEGTSDRALLPILQWLLGQHLPNRAIQPQWADPSRFPRSPRTLADKISLAVSVFPCDILFVHRDSDGPTRTDREQEIKDSVGQVDLLRVTVICVIPVRMTESWLLTNEDALRRASGKPKAGPQLVMPPPRQIEVLPNPKERLRQLLRDASGLTGRRLKKFDEGERTQRIANLMEDYGALRQLSAFQALEADVVSYAKTLLRAEVAHLKDKEDQAVDRE